MPTPNPHTPPQIRSPSFPEPRLSASSPALRRSYDPRLDVAGRWRSDDAPALQFRTNQRRGGETKSAKHQQPRWTWTLSRSAVQERRRGEALVLVAVLRGRLPPRPLLRIAWHWRHRQPSTSPCGVRASACVRITPAEAPKPTRGAVNGTREESGPGFLTSFSCCGAVQFSFHLPLHLP